MTLCASVLLLAMVLFAEVTTAQWTQVWGDEFDGAAIDRRKWDFEVNCYGGGNNEK